MTTVQMRYLGSADRQFAPCLRWRKVEHSYVRVRVRGEPPWLKSMRPYRFTIHDRRDLTS